MAKVMSTKMIAAIMAVTACVSSFGISAFADELPAQVIPEQPVCSTTGEESPVVGEKTASEVSAVTEDVVPSEKTETACTAPEKMAPTMGAVTESEVSGAPEIIVGDANGDGVVNVEDITAVSAYLKGIGTVDDLDAADVNDDGVVTVSDLSMISAIVKGIA